MEKIVQHIERLLLWHNCVIIPEFGGFVLQRVPATYTDDEHLFVPVRKEIVFNPTLTHNDGLLTESYMQEYAMDFDEAWKYVRADALGMKEELDNDRQIKFGRIGLFIKEGERIIFLPSKNSDELFCLSSYGLPVFYYLSLVARGASIHNMDDTTGSTTNSLGKMQFETNNRANNRPESNRIIYTIPVTRTFVRVFAATVAAIVLFLLISTPVEDVNNASYAASFVPSEIMLKKSADETVFNTFADKDIPDVETNKTAMNAAGETETETVPEVKAEFPAIKPEPEITIETRTKPGRTVSATSATKSSSTVASKFYVIIGSYKTHAQAQKHINRLESDIAGNAGIIVNDGKVRVYVQQFSNEKQALSYLNKIRQNPSHQQAWLYKGR